MFGMEDLLGKGNSRPGLGGKEISGRSGVGGCHYIQKVMDRGRFDESQKACSTWGGLTSGGIFRHLRSCSGPDQQTDRARVFD